MEKIQIRQGELNPELASAVKAGLQAVNEFDFAALYAAEQIILTHTDLLGLVAATELEAIFPTGECLVPAEIEPQIESLLAQQGLYKRVGARIFCIPQ